MKFKNFFVKTQNNYYQGIKDRKIIDNNNLIEKYIEKEKSINEILFTIRQAMRIILSKYKNESGKYGIHSNSTNTGIVVEWKPDNNISENINHANIISILPKREKHLFKANDVSLLIESIEKDINDSDFKLILVN